MMSSRQNKGGYPFVGRVSGRFILFSFFLLLVFVSVTLLTSTSKLFVIVGVPSKMKSGLYNMLKNVGASGVIGVQQLNTSMKVRSFQTKEEVNKDFDRWRKEHDANGGAIETVHDNTTTHTYNSTSTVVLEQKAPANVMFLGISPTKNDSVTTRRPSIPMNVLGNLYNSSKVTRQSACDGCFQHNFSYVIQNSAICNVTDGQTIDLIILILTVHKNFKARSAIRNTWVTHSGKNTKNIRYVFLLGETRDEIVRKTVIQESELHHDILMEDFVDSYKNLTYKTIMGFKWTATMCAHARFVLKTDDDMFVNIPNLLRALESIGEKKMRITIIGACNQKSRPIRNKKSKWFASNESYPDRYYPGFCSGTGYATSVALASDVYRISPQVPFFHLEDVYVSLCVRKLGYHLQGVPGFSAGRPKIDPCLYKGSKLITAHQLPPIMLQLIWNRECRRPAIQGNFRPGQVGKIT